MRFLYPLGLLGLIGVPILIIIYIIKNKYTEQVISSTYLWTLSEKFLKKRLPINKLVGIISLILQLVAVILISLAVAHPVLIMRGSANDYCFVLDCSGSMNIVQGDKTRLDLAKDEIATLIDDSKNGSAYTLVTAGATANTIFEDVTDKETALRLLSDVSASYVASGFTDALGTAQEYFSANPSMRTYLITDKSFERSENVDIVNVASAVSNYALSDIGYSLTEDGLSVTGKALSYEDDASITVELYIDGLPNASASERISLTKLQSADFKFDCAEKDFSYFKVVIKESDALLLDNEITVFNVEYENSYSVLLVSDKPFFINAVLNISGNARTKIISPNEYKSADGYDLCIFDSFTPETLPEHSAIWFFNPTQSVARSGFTVQDQIEHQIGVVANYTTSTKSEVKTFLKDVDRDDLYVKKYQKCGLYRNFTTLLSCDDNPLVFTGTNEFGNREVVFAFDLHDSDYPVQWDFVVLSRNLLNYSFPTVVENASYLCGDTLSINVVANCDSIRVDSPLGTISYLDTVSAVSELQLTEVGAYKITVISGGETKVYNVYSAFPQDEGAPVASEEEFSLHGEAEEGRRDGIFDNLWILFLILAVIFAADWVVYCYDQYQLR